MSAATDSKGAAQLAQNCGTCGHWHCPIRQVGVGQCRANPPPTSFNWPRTREDQVCGQWKPRDTLAKDIAPGATAAGGTREPATDGAHNQTAPAGGKDSPTAKPAALSGAGGPPSLLQRTLRAGQRGSRQQ